MSESPYVFDVRHADFATRVLEKSNQVPIVVDFWAAWCAPCRMLMPMLSKLADEYQGKFLLAKVNTDEEQKLAGEQGIRSLPTVRVYKYGTVAEEFMGARPESGVREVIERHILRESDLQYQEAITALHRGETVQAARLLEEVVLSDTRNKDAIITLAKLYFGQQQYDKVEPLLKNLGMEAADHAEALELKARLQFVDTARKARPLLALEQAVAAHPDDYDARYQLGALKVLTGEYEGALEQFIEIMRHDRRYRDDAGRKAILAVFDILGGRGPLVNRYRALMASALH